MSTLELKKKLIGRILQTESITLLNEVFRLLELGEECSEVGKLTTEKKRAIQDGLEEISSGCFLTNEQADREIQEWLSK